jgi:lipid A 3-O-deacylase
MTLPSVTTRLWSGRGPVMHPVWAAVLALGLAAEAAARPAQDCQTRSPVRSSGTFNVRTDNDLFGGIGQDQGYTNGFLLSWVSPNLVDYLEDPCLPRIAMGLNRYLAWLQPGGFDEQNMTIGFGQVMYTPADRVPTELIANDRPYAGALILSIGYNARIGDVLRTSQIRVGMVGPSAYAEQVQSQWHDIIGVDRFNGWDNQLRDEPVLQLIHERRTRVTRRQIPKDWGWDLTRHWGASLGNFATYTNVGGEFRIGIRLPDDFGTLPLRPAGENTSPVKEIRHANWSAHAFVGIDARWVLYDITLDGNTYGPSHSVDKRPLVADLGYGAAMYVGHWRVALARYRRTREFVGQEVVPVYGTITIGRRF